ncbi:hypothetical protein [Microbulbifer epialgicus]|uniref:Uncharacterized protein n=1 Tax=Microbulbifer epialgicus TaxID=393907 RepID=A0ABV4P6G8_9GAMM
MTNAALSILVYGWALTPANSSAWRLTWMLNTSYLCHGRISTVVPTGARELKREFAEDPENLWLVDDGRNQSKDDKGPDEWMPPYKPVQTAIVGKYGPEFSPEESA